jgi:hypothetical protein
MWVAIGSGSFATDPYDGTPLLARAQRPTWSHRLLAYQAAVVRASPPAAAAASAA